MRKILEGQTAVVTGANSGIGKGVAQALAESGSKVVVNYITNERDADEVVAAIKESGGEAMKFKADVGREEEVREMFSAAVKSYGTVDILVSNAGIQKDASFQEMTLKQWDGVLKVNLTGAFLCAREATREFLRRGMSPRSKSLGKIIFVSSVHEVIPWAGHANYATSKGGIMMLMKSIAQELAPQKIRVNSIGPGAIETNINKGAWSTEAERNKLLELIPYGRIGLPSDIGPVAVWLASDEADYVTGTTLFADGGMLLYPGFRTGG